MIIVENVSREFSNTLSQRTKEEKMQIKTVIKNLTFHIPKGEIVGIIGSNGAGKSTLLKLITGLLTPTSGYVRTCGVDPVIKSKKLVPKLSVVFGTSSNLIEEATVQESFLLMKAMYKISEKDYESRLGRLNDILNLNEIMLKTRHELSFGEAKRATLAMNLLPDMELLVLDEALVGIDSVRKERVFEYLQERNQNQKVTIVITSHNLEDVKAICRRVLVLHKGESLYYGNIGYLLEKYANHVMIKILYKDTIPDVDDLAIERYTIEDHEMTIYYNRNRISEKTILSCILEQCVVRDITVLEPSLEDALLTILNDRDTI